MSASIPAFDDFQRGDTSMHPTFRKLMTTAVIGMTLGAGSAWAQKEMNDPFREPALAALRGKTIAYLPISLVFYLAQAWGGVIKQEAYRYGMKFNTKDPNWSTEAMAQGMTSLIVHQ